MKIKKNKLISLDKFIDDSLYNEKFGYYMKKNPFGAKGDFITAPNICYMDNFFLEKPQVSYKV